MTALIGPHGCRRPEPRAAMGPVLIGFFAASGARRWRCFMLALSFCTDRFLLLIAGLALGVAALSIEGLRLVKSWTV